MDFGNVLIRSTRSLCSLPSLIHVLIEYEAIFFEYFTQSFLKISFFFLQILTCVFNNFVGCDLSTSNFAAAFVSGVFFFAYPNVQLFAHAMSCVAQISWQRLLDKKPNEIHPILTQINQLPIAKLVYTFGFAYLSHVRTFFPWDAPSFLKRVITLVTNGQ